MRFFQMKGPKRKFTFFFDSFKPFLIRSSATYTI
jgi:hypothetical protein